MYEVRPGDIVAFDLGEGPPQAVPACLQEGFPLSPPAIKHGQLLGGRQLTKPPPFRGGKNFLSQLVHAFAGAEELNVDTQVTAESDRNQE